MGTADISEQLLQIHGVRQILFAPKIPSRSYRLLSGKDVKSDEQIVLEQTVRQDVRHQHEFLYSTGL